VAAPFAFRIGSAESNDILALLPSSAQSTQALRLDRQFPSGRNLEAIVVFRRNSGLTAADRTLITRTASRVDQARINGTAPAGSVIYSPDNKAALFIVPVAPNQQELVGAVADLRRTIPSGGGLQSEVTGTGAFNADLFSSFSGVDFKLLVVTAGLVIVLLLVTYQSPFLWAIPLVGVGIAVILADATVYALARAGLTVTGESVGLLTVVVFGAGTDYALLLTARYREELRRHIRRDDAMAAALRAVSASIVSSSVTVAAALACLLAASFNVSRSFGIVGAVGVMAALLAMLTVYPALLVSCSRRVFWPRIPRTGSVEPTHRGAWAKIGQFISAHPRPYWIGAVALLGVLSLGLITTNTSITTLDDLPTSAGSVRGAKLLTASFPAGETTPADVVVTNPARLSDVRAALARAPGVSALGAVERVDNLARFDVIFSSAATGDKAFSRIVALRRIADQASGGAVLVGGQTAQDYDLAQVSHRDQFVVIPLVLVVVMAVLMLLLRALVGPLLVTLTVVGTYAASLGACSVIFTSILGYPGVDPTVPLLGFVFLVALGVDYNVFLLGRVSQEVSYLGAVDGVTRGLAATGGVLTSAGLILAGTFSVLSILPLLPSKEIGVLVAFGVLLDTLVVRTILVPSLAIDTSRWFWWPRRLPAAEAAAIGDQSHIRDGIAG
jgi:RND superfamily putative drug exporter